MADIKIDTIRERDVDIVIMREFFSNKSFIDLFLKQIDINDYEILSVNHSVMDTELGESDIEVILSTNKGKVALLIENKINVIQQPKQYERYIKRGDKKVNDGEVVCYYVFMTAPKTYFSASNKYQHRVTYEEMLQVMTDAFSINTIKQAMEKKDAYQPIADEDVSDFWSKLYKYVSESYPSLYDIMPTKTEKERGARAQWPGFRTDVADMEIQWKADRGAVDLQLNGMADYKQQIEEMLGEAMPDHPYKVVLTGKSSSIRKTVPQVDFHKFFAEQKESIDMALNAVLGMYGLAHSISDGIKRIKEGYVSPLLQKAIKIATDAHKGQKDKAGADYISHPLRVAARLKDEKEKIVAVLHDTIEDTFVTADYLAEQGFSQEIIDGVLSVTHKDEETYDDFVRRAARNPLGRAVKEADLEDNMDIRRLNFPMDEREFKRLNKYLKAYKYLKGLAN